MYCGVTLEETKDTSKLSSSREAQRKLEGNSARPLLQLLQQHANQTVAAANPRIPSLVTSSWKVKATGAVQATAKQRACSPTPVFTSIHLGSSPSPGAACANTPVPRGHSKCRLRDHPCTQRALQVSLARSPLYPEGTQARHAQATPSKQAIKQATQQRKRDCGPSERALASGHVRCRLRGCGAEPLKKATVL